MVCVCPPHTSMNLNRSSPASSVMAATSARAASGSRNSSMNRIASSRRIARRPAAPLDDRRRVERLDLVRVGLAQLLHRLDGELGLLLVDLRHGEAHVDEHPVVGPQVLVGEEPDADRPLQAAHVDLGEVLLGVDDLDHPSRNPQAHVAVSFTRRPSGRWRLLRQQMRGSGSPTSMSTIRVPPKAVRTATVADSRSVISPMTTASRPSGCSRMAASAASVSSGATTASTLPSLAT